MDDDLEIYYKNKKKTFHFEKCEIGDFVKFKIISRFTKEQMKQGIFVKNKYSVYYGTVSNNLYKEYLGINIICKNESEEFPRGLEIWIDRRSALQIYPLKLVKYITPRLSLKHIWKDLVFREVKTVKCKGLKNVEYHHVNNSGFPRSKLFVSYEDATLNVNPDNYKNITVKYDEYFGFTYDKAIRNNDKYYDREIFFSKKCYCELDWSDKNPTGDFLLNERAFNDIPPRPGKLICGLIENGEKGLFYRKWFICSREFLLLWTMMCDPKDSSLKEKKIDNLSFEHLHDQEYIKKRSKHETKSFNKLLKELSTSCYQIDMKKEVKERERKYLHHNLERAALYYPNRYQNVCESIFGNDSLKKEDDESEQHSNKLNTFQKKLIKNIMWMK